MRGRGGLAAACLVAGALLGSGSALAADAKGRAVVHGGVPCKQVVEWRDKNVDNALVWWVSGWISAHNRLMADTFDLADGNLEGLVRSVESYCRYNPNSNLGEAGVYLINILQPNRQKLPK